MGQLGTHAYRAGEVSQLQKESLHVTIPQKAHPLVRPIFEAMRRKQYTYGDLERRSGVSWWTVRRWRRGQLPELGNLLAVYKILGIELKAVVRLREREKKQ